MALEKSLAGKLTEPERDFVKKIVQRIDRYLDDNYDPERGYIVSIQISRFIQSEGEKELFTDKVKRAVMNEYRSAGWNVRDTGISLDFS